MLVFKVQKGEIIVDDISFDKYPERLDEVREKSLAGFNTKLSSLLE